MGKPVLTILPDPPLPPTGVGVIAGGGRLPLLVAEGLRSRGNAVHGLGLCRQFDPAFPGLCDSFREVGLLRIGQWCKALARQGVHHAIMVGRVDKAKVMHDPFRAFRNVPDLRTLQLWLRCRRDRRSHALLAAIAEELDRGGVALLDSTIPIPDDLAEPGVMTTTRPTAEQRGDVEFIWPMMTRLLAFDIGQAIAVRDRDVLAVEAIEGTDRMIDRVGGLCKAKGWTLCKGARAGHDRRSDVPTVGVTTIERLHAAGGRCLALAAGDVIMVDKAEMIRRADELGIAILGVAMASSGVVLETKPLGQPIAARV